MRAHEFITPESDNLVWFHLEGKPAIGIIKKKFGKVIRECGGVLNVPGKYWTLIQNLAYTAGGLAELTDMPKKCAKKTKVKYNDNTVNINTATKTITFESLNDEDDLEEEEQENVLTPQFDLATDKINDAGAGVQAHTQIDNYVQSASATQKPIKNVPSP
jgi:hypothetical protein